MKVTLKNPRTAELREIKVGWSWTMFLFSGFWGVPLFLRKLDGWGTIFVGFEVISELNYRLAPAKLGRAEEAQILCTVFGLLGILIFLSKKGNEMTAKNYLERGWEFVNPESADVKYAKSEWGIHM